VPDLVAKIRIAKFSKFDLTLAGKFSKMNRQVKEPCKINQKKKTFSIHFHLPGNTMSLPLMDIKGINDE